MYRGKNEAGADCDWMLAWSNPWDRLLFDNKVCVPSARNCMPCIHNIAPFTTLKKSIVFVQAYTEIREAHHFEGNVWDTISDRLFNSGLEHTEMNGMDARHL